MEEKILAEMLQKDPLNEVLASMLCDEIMESRELTRPQAELQVKIVRVAGIQARDLARAAELLRDDSPYRYRLQEKLSRTNPEGLLTSYSRVLAYGPDMVKWHANYRSNPGAWWYEWTVTVMTGWVLARVAEMQAAEKAEQTRRRSRRDRGAK